MHVRFRMFPPGALPAFCNLLSRNQSGILQKRLGIIYSNPFVIAGQGTSKLKSMRSMRIIALLLITLATTVLWGQQWVPLGPDGGDVRSLTRDPYAANRILLSTSAGQIYESINGGANWQRLAKLGEGNDYVLDTILFHPAQAGVIYVAAWSVENSGGDIFRSFDNGKNWKPLKEMHGKSVRAFAMATSNPDVLIAGALDGVYRSKDGGDHWSLVVADQDFDKMSPAPDTKLPAFALVLLKPSLFPVAFVGVRSRGWWLAVAAVAAVSDMVLVIGPPRGRRSERSAPRYVPPCLTAAACAGERSR